MNRFSGIPIVAFLLAMTGTAHAGQTITSASIFGSTDQTSATCTIRNVGLTQVSVQVAILDESGTAVTLTQDNCNGLHLAGGSACSITATAISNGFAYACSATSLTVKNLRGAMVLIVSPHAAAADFPVRSTPLR